MRHLRVIAVISSKGGSGKSQIARSLSVAAVLDGHRAAIIDADPQGTCTAWGKRRTVPAPHVEALAGDIRAAIPRLQAKGAEIVILDSPPHSNTIINLIVAASDLCLIPVAPYPEDLESIGSTVRIVKALDKPGAIILNRCQPRT